LSIASRATTRRSVSYFVPRQASVMTKAVCWKFESPVICTDPADTGVPVAAGAGDDGASEMAQPASATIDAKKIRRVATVMVVVFS
jgi:hypothetical protein